MDLNKITFLVVDDFSTMRRIIRGLLREIGYQSCEEAEDGQVALQILNTAASEGRAGSYFVIADINMPNVNGFKMLEEIKASVVLKSIPVLMVTAEARKEDIVFAAKTGAAGYIVKPFTKAAFAEKITKIAAKLPK